MRLPLLPMRPLVGPLKTLASAQTGLVTLPGGQLRMTIEHDTLRGITPTMLRWWFEHLGDPMDYEGVRYPRYLLWHPIDHIHWELAVPAPGGGAARGASFRIVEAFGANPAHHVDSVEQVEKLDNEGISLVRRVFGTEVFRLEHRFGETAGGASYRSRMVVGASGGAFGRFFNAAVRQHVFSDDMGAAWLRHNVEEVGLLEHLLPLLYPSRS
jgi:hypothetical protein